MQEASCCCSCIVCLPDCALVWKQMNCGYIHTDLCSWTRGKAVWGKGAWCAWVTPACLHTKNAVPSIIRKMFFTLTKFTLRRKSQNRLLAFFLLPLKILHLATLWSLLLRRPTIATSPTRSFMFASSRSVRPPFCIGSPSTCTKKLSSTC